MLLNLQMVYFFNFHLIYWFTGRYCTFSWKSSPRHPRAWHRGAVAVVVYCVGVGACSEFGDGFACDVFSLMHVGRCRVCGRVVWMHGVRRVVCMHGVRRVVLWRACTACMLYDMYPPPHMTCILLRIWHAAWHALHACCILCPYVYYAVYALPKYCRGYAFTHIYTYQDTYIQCVCTIIYTYEDTYVQTFNTKRISVHTLCVIIVPVSFLCVVGSRVGAGPLLQVRPYPWH